VEVVGEDRVGKDLHAAEVCHGGPELFAQHLLSHGIDHSPTPSAACRLNISLVAKMRFRCGLDSEEYTSLCKATIEQVDRTWFAVGPGIVPTLPAISNPVRRTIKRAPNFSGAPLVTYLNHSATSLAEQSPTESVVEGRDGQESEDGREAENAFHTDCRRTNSGDRRHDSQKTGSD